MIDYPTPEAVYVRAAVLGLLKVADRPVSTGDIARAIPNTTTKRNWRKYVKSRLSRMEEDGLVVSYLGESPEGTPTNYWSLTSCARSVAMSISFPFASMTLTPVVEDANSFTYQCEKTRRYYKTLFEDNPLAKLVAEFTYKPGWFFGTQTLTNQVWFRATAVVENSYHPGRFVPITLEISAESPLVGMVSYYELVSNSLFEVINLIEGHERKEWLKHCDVLVRDPHVTRAPGVYTKPFTGS